jgi:YggT family protein
VVLDAAGTALQFVGVFIYVYILVLFLWVVASWIKLPYSLSPVQRFLNDVCDPYLRLWRKVIPMVGPLDLSPMVGILALFALEALINRLQ